MDGLQSKHSDFAGLQAKYNIPGEFCMPEELFREEQLDYSIMYYKRCCSVYDFYNLLSKDNPCYVERKLRRVNNANGGLANREPPAVQEGRYKSERRESPVVQENMTFSKSHGTARSSNPAYNPFIHANVRPQRRGIIDIKSTNPSDLNREQRDAAEKAERRRRAPQKNAPIPEDGDSTNTDGETSMLYENKLLPAANSQILKLRTAIKRIKSKTYEYGYLKEREKAITAAEADRLSGLDGPTYLAGVKTPWMSDRGHAPIHYDVYQVDRLQSQIERIRSSNAVMCQLEYTANKGGPGGQARS
jgi:hypothetical protein